MIKNKKVLLTILMMLLLIGIANVCYADAALTTIEVTTPPTKTAYIEGETFDPTGMVVLAKYDDNSEHTVTGFTYPTSQLSYIASSAEITYTENGITVRCEQTITVDTAMEELIVTESITLDLKSNLTWGLVAKASPNGTTLPELIWTSADESIAKVQADADSAATLVAVSVGKTTVTVRTVDGKFSATCNVTVTNGLEGIDTPTGEEPAEPSGIDGTVANGRLPNAGVTTTIILSVILVAIIGGTYAYKKIKEYKGI